jgi:N-hydroxyarylamine O-acetyltransferase
MMAQRILSESRAMDINRYLEWIYITQTEDPSYSTLARLQWHHLCFVPFENLDILRGQPIILDQARLYDKIVRHHRGGFCYELNGLFAWLLQQLGFSVSMLSARVYRSNLDQFSPEFDHMLLLVHLDRPLLVDVGFGDSARKPVVLPDGVVEDISGAYRIQQMAADAEWHLLERNRVDRWQPLYTFTTQPRALSEYQSRCDFHQTAPESHFKHGTICSVATETGRLSLTDDALIITKDNTKERIPISSSAVYDQLLREYFGIRLGDG